MRPLLTSPGSSRPVPRLEFRVSSPATGCGFAVAGSSRVVADSEEAVVPAARGSLDHRLRAFWTGRSQASQELARGARATTARSVQRFARARRPWW